MDEFNRENNQNTGEQNTNPSTGEPPVNNNEDNGSIESQGTNYVFWAEEAASKIQNTMPQYDAATYSYTKEDLGEDGKTYIAGNDSSNTNTSYGTYRDVYTQPNSTYSQSMNGSMDGGGQKGRKKRDKKPNGFGKKAVKLVAGAAVFGLVAGVVFQGVDMAADSLFPRKQNPTINYTDTVPNNKTAATTISNGMNTSTDLTELVENTMPSIVSITSTMTQDYKYFGQTFSEEYDGSGSGIIVGENDTELLIVTNNHVVEGAKAIAVNFINDSVYEAKIKGTDAAADLAVVAVKLKDLDDETKESIKIATLGSSDDVKVGQMAIAIGNALGSGQSVTVGYISAKNRQVNTTGTTSQGSQLQLLQTDAAINPGNSGGALLNINGEVIGINDLKYADTNVEGMGYAIPISEAVPIINELMNREILEEDEKGYLGITGINITEDKNYYDMPIGVHVYAVAENGAAAEGGIQKGDIIIKINGVSTTTIERVQNKVNSIRAGSTITVTVMRSNNGTWEEKELEVTLKDKSSLDSLNDSEGNTQNNQNDKKGNFGYTPEDGSNSGDENNIERTIPYEAPDGDSSSLEDFFNQFN